MTAPSREKDSLAASKSQLTVNFCTGAVENQLTFDE